MVVFDDSAYLAKPVSPVETTNMAAIGDHILELEPQGGTNMEAGYRRGSELLDEYVGADAAEYENRIIFLTDAMPNVGATSDGSLLEMVQTNAEARVHTTFIGIGVDFNTELIEAITSVRGANYYSVHSEERFKDRMDEEFEYMVTPLVFDLELKLQSGGFEIEAVYGSPEADEATGVLMRVNTLFPAASEGGETRGGVVLLKLRRTGDATDIELTASYRNRNDEAFNVSESFDFTAELDVAPNTGIQKAILLSRYVNLMQEWIAFEREGLTVDPNLSEWEQTSVPLVVSPEYQELFQTFLEGFQTESASLGDPTLEQEATLLQTLIDWTPDAEQP
jgi:Ca-activated chloride channel family protein